MMTPAHQQTRECLREDTCELPVSRAGASIDRTRFTIAALLVALLVDDVYAVGGVHDRLVLLVPVHLVVLMPGLAEDLNDLPLTGGRTVDARVSSQSPTRAAAGVFFALM